MSGIDTSDVSNLREAWDYFRAAGDGAREALEATERFQRRADHRAWAYQVLLEAQAMAYDIALAPRMDHPIINTRTWFHNSHTLGGTSGDLWHVSAVVDGRHTYRLSGRVGDVKSLVMQSFNTLLGGANQHQVADADLAAMADDEGRFEAILSATEQPGDWIALDPTSETNFLFIRRFYDDWYGDHGEIDIELLDGPIDNRDGDGEAMSARIRRAADLLSFLVKGWSIGVYDMYLRSNGGRKNALAVVPGSQIASDTAGSPSTIYTWGIYDIADDEALLIEMEPADAKYWSVQIQNVWTKPIDHLNHQSEINQRQAAIDEDGKFRAVICLDDPGLSNWLDPSGQTEGTIICRAYHAAAVPAQPTVSVIKAADLEKHLPPETRRTTAEQRAEDMVLRRRGILQMFGDL